MNLDDVFIEYINNHDWKKSLLLHGNWGVGKTSSLKNFFESLSAKDKLKNHTHYCFINGYDITETFNLKKHIINNSFKIGTKDLDPLINDVISNMQKNYNKLPFWVRNAISALEKGAKATAKTQIGVEFEISGILSKFFDDHIEYVCQSPKIKECIVIIDELDRNTETDLKIIFSKIIDLLENLHMKVILVSNLDALASKDDFESWAEKIIDFKVEYDYKENTKIDTHILKFSQEFQIYFKKYRSAFSNYRTYERYISFEKMIDDRYKKYFSSPSKMRLINEFKELVFYVLFMTENPAKFESNLDVKKSLLPRYLPYPNMKAALNFISLNATQFYSKLDKCLADNSDPTIIIRDHYKEYQESKSICHAKHKKYSIDNPEGYIINIINTYLKHLNILSLDPSLKINPYLDLSYWVKELNLYIKNNSSKTIILNILKLKFNDTILIKDNSNVSKMNFFNKDADKIIAAYKTNYSEYPEFVEYVEIKITEKKEVINKEFKNSLILEDDEIIVTYFVNNIDDLLNKIIMTSDNYFHDLSLIKKYMPEWYDKTISEYLEKAPNENDRIIKDYILNRLKDTE